MNPNLNLIYGSCVYARRHKGEYIYYADYTTNQMRYTWGVISIHAHLSEDFIIDFREEIVIDVLIKHQQLSSALIKMFDNVVSCNSTYWRNISIYQTLSEDFIKEFQNKVDWVTITANQTLSEDFIREFRDRVDWELVSIHQTLSEDFIREFHDRVDWDCIRKYQTLSEDFIKEFQDEILK